jgi:GrpB-like predicted nucleotidyltransferase (UPF0157 family)
LTIRDHLRENATAATKYGQLKQQLAQRYPADIDSYVAGKTDFLVDVLQSAGSPKLFYV